MVLGIAGRVAAEVDHQADDGGRLEGLLHDAQTMDLEMALQGLHRAGHQTAVPVLEPGPVVADQPCETARLRRAQDDLPRKRGFARARRAPDQEPGLAHDHAARMKGLQRGQGSRFR
jgi:hypothetical protein